MISILTGSDLSVFVFVFGLQTRHIFFLVDFESTCLVHASLTFNVCLFFFIFCSPLQIAWLLFLFTKDQDHWMGENIFAKLDIFVCVFVFAFFVCLCRLHACCYPFAKDQWEKTSLRCLTKHSPHLFTKTMHSQLSITDAWNFINNLHLTSVKKVRVSWFRQNFQ